MIESATLELIKSRDPNEDGERDERPTHAENLSFRAWVIDTYGAHAWRAYLENLWEPAGGGPDVA